MSEDTGSDFFYFAERHSHAVADVIALRLRPDHEGSDDARSALAEAVATERHMRAALVDWKPTSNAEAQFKLLYITQYLVAMGSSLNDEEMTAIRNSICHL